MQEISDDIYLMFKATAIGLYSWFRDTVVSQEET